MERRRSQKNKHTEMRIYEVRPRKDKRGVDLISDVLPYGALWYAEPNAISNAINYAKFRSRSHNAVIRVIGPAAREEIEANRKELCACLARDRIILKAIYEINEGYYEKTIIFSCSFHVPMAARSLAGGRLQRALPRRRLHGQKFEHRRDTQWTSR